MEERGISVSRACKIVSLPRSQFYYTSKKDDTAIISKLECKLPLFPAHRDLEFSSFWAIKTELE